MLVLSRIQALHIRGSFYSVVQSIQLSDVRLDVASEDGRGSVALNVEQCQCPVNYIGTSCEQCAPGYYRSKQGPYLGACVPCQCNNRATMCDPDSGECQNCRDNFHGPQCLACKRGYYLDDYTGRCEICSCPLPQDSNNFAATCQVFRGIVDRCDCLPGYTGTKCERCDVGYWGNPTRIGDSCRPCECSGNIDLDDPQSCDINTGRCVECLHNTGGDRCERCKDWYYGDAIDLKNCRACNCDTIGSELCDHQSGSCLCKPNVVGATCDRCRSGAFGFESGRGCDLCNCGPASVSSDCDVYSGQCQCRPGVTGRKCDQCEQGYWNYGPRGCQSCTCLSSGAVTCDPLTGQCQCLPGVTGPNCDQCLPRWIMIPGVGCNECDNCIHLLMDDIEIIDHNITSMRRELDSVSVGILAFQRLEKINQTVAELRPLVDNLINRPTDPSQLNPIKRELYQVQTLATEVNTKSDRTVRNSELVESDAADVKIRAENLYQELVQMAIREANDAVDFVKGILDAIQGSIGSNNIEELLRQAETMLNDIKSRDFSSKDEAARVELEAAIDALRRAKELMDRATAQSNRTVEINIFIDDIMNKLHDLQNSSRHSLDHSQAAADMNTRIRQLKIFVTDTISKIRQTQTDIRSCIDRAKRLLDDARRFLIDATKAYNDVESESSKLDVAIGELQLSVGELSRENTVLRPLVDEAREHAERLKKQAEMLESLIADTRESAEAALNASNAYQAIINAINSALNASLEAIRVAEEASGLSSGLAEQAARSRERSVNLKEEADGIADKVEYDLKIRLINAKKRIEEVIRINVQIREQLIEMVMGLDMLPTGGYGDKARQAADKAMNAQTKAEAAEQRIKQIVDQLPEDQRKLAEIPKDIDQANRNMRAAEMEIQQVIRLVPNVTDILSRLSSHADRIRKLGIDLRTSIMLLKNNVSTARDQANLIRVGMSFDVGSSLQVRNPQNILTAGAYSRVSLYFRTTAPNGLLFYAGPESSQEQWNYMSLQIIGGKAVFKFNLGSGVAVITSDKTVSDGAWHQAILERTGRNGILTIQTDEEPDNVVNGSSEGDSSVLDFDHATHVFIGGIPKAFENNLKDHLIHITYTGCLEDVKFDGVAVGLWNFVSAENVKGCVSRDVLPEPQINGYMFGGNGYVILAKDRFNPSKASLVKFSFRTFASEGLMFLMGTPGKDFLSLEIKDGKVIYQYELGSGRATIASTQRYNDGKWHEVSANRMNQDGILKVDANTVNSARSPGNLKDLDIDTSIYFGGFKGTHTYSNASVTQKGFEGCIKNIQLGSTNKNINEHIEAKDILPGCPETVRIVSFTRDVDGGESYIRTNPVDIGVNYEMSMKFKTLENDGLLFYVTDDLTAQKSAFSISLSNGKVVVMNMVDGALTALQSRDSTYNDGRWHYLTVRKDGRDMSLHLDDSDSTTTKLEGGRRTATRSPAFFGGFPSTNTIVLGNVASSAPFVGCIGDVTIKQEFINFADVPPDNMIGVVLSSCFIPDPTPSTTPFPLIIPTFPTRGPVAPTGLPPDKCYLPIEPLMAGDEPERGYRFGSKPGSRQEYDGFPSNNNNKAEYSVEFKTTSSKGVIFYVANKEHVDFVGIYINKGLVSAAFNCGGGVARATLTNAYNDGQWHTLVFKRNLKEGMLSIDDDAETVSVTAPGNPRSIEVIAPYYVGGLPPDISSRGASNLENVSSGFVGCLRNFLQDGKDIGEPDDYFDVDECSMSTEVGTFFYADAGHLVVSDNFTVGLDLDITLEIKPRTLSGVLFSVHNQGRGAAGGDYLVLQMVNGEVIFSMDNGRGNVTTKYTPPTKNQLCDGQWHTIRAQKAKNVVVLEVDKVFTNPGSGPEGVSNTNTEDPLYVGGVPDLHRGILTSDHFVGCMRRLELNKVVQDFSEAQHVGRIKTDSCPTT